MSNFPFYKYFWYDALFFIWEWQSISHDVFNVFVIYPMLTICSMVRCAFFQFPVSNSQTSIPYYAFLSWVNSMNFSPISYVKSHYVFDTTYEHIVA